MLLNKQSLDIVDGVKDWKIKKNKNNAISKIFQKMWKNLIQYLCIYLIQATIKYAFGEGKLKILNLILINIHKKNSSCNLKTLVSMKKKLINNLILCLELSLIGIH